MSWSAPAFGELATLLEREVGLDFPDARITFAELAMRRAMSRAHERDVAAFARRVAREPALRQSLIAEVVVGETYFFRDATQFDVLRTVVLPEICARRPSDSIDIWSAGCATGEEAYSLAILLETSGAAERTRIMATDVSAAAIASAQRGRYPARSFRGDTEPWRSRCFLPERSAWTIDPRFRGRIAFAVHNLLGPPDGTRQFDLILCRNVLIYLAPEALARAQALLAERLAPGGWLITSPTDPLFANGAGIEQVETAAGIAYRRAIARPPATAPRELVALAAARRRPPPRASRAPRPVVTRLPAVAAQSDAAAAEPHVAEALRLLDGGRPFEALAAARRARYLDRTSPVAHLALGRAFRLCGRIDAARRSLRRSRVLLATHVPDEPVRGADGASAGALAAMVAAELTLLARRRERRL